MNSSAPHPLAALASLRTGTENLLRRYHARFPDEATRHRVLMEQLGAGEQIFSRSNMTGHVTTSAALLNRAATKVLLVHHRFLRKWLPPGGHYEAPGSLWESALREVAEETGVLDVEPHEWTKAQGGMPIDVDTHPIPANPHKGEAQHLHHDFRFLAVADDTRPLLAQLDEVHDARWVQVTQLRDSPDERVRALYAKLERLGAVV